MFSTLFCPVTDLNYSVWMVLFYQKYNRGEFETTDDDAIDGI